MLLGRARADGRFRNVICVHTRWTAEPETHVAPFEEALYKCLVLLGIR